MSQRRVINVIEQYRKSRMQFVQTIADLAIKPQNTKTLISEGVMSFLHTLMMDVDPAIQQATVLALGRLADHKSSLAEAVVRWGLLPQMVQSLDPLSQNNFLRKEAAFVLQAVAKHSPELAQAAVDAKAGPFLVFCLTMRDDVLSRTAAAALGNISKHTLELAQAVVETGAIAYLAQLIVSKDAKLKREVLSALCQISKHSVSLTEMVIEAEVFPAALVSLKDQDEYVRENVITLMKEVVKQSPELSQVIVSCGGLVVVIDYLGYSYGNLRLPGIMMLGYIAAHSEKLAMAVIFSKGLPQLAACLSEESEQQIKLATVWSIGQIGHHTPEHAKAVATASLLPKLLELYLDASSSEDLQAESEKALKSILQKCTDLQALEPLLSKAPTNILEHFLCQFIEVLPHDSRARRMFVTSGALKKVQEIKAEPDSALQQHISAIKSCFPEDVVRYYSPGYSEELLKLLDGNQTE